MYIWAAKQTWVSKHARKKAKYLNKDNISKIAIIKHAALGDMIQVRPMLITLKEAFPNAIITLSVISNYTKGIPEDLIDNLHVAKGNDKKYSIKTIYRSFKELGSQDIIFDISATTRSFWITKLNSATLKIGFTHKNLHRYLYDVALPRAHYRFEGETFLEQLHIIGLNYDWPLRYDYPIPERIYQKPYIVYFPTASASDKCWPAQYMEKLLIEMINKYPNTDHLLLSGLAEWEKEIADSITNKVGTHTNFKKLDAGPDDISLICHAIAIIINDTGLRHIAIAAGTPTVCIFPMSPNAFSYSPLFGNHKAVVAGESGPAPVSEVASALNDIISTK